MDDNPFIKVPNTDGQSDYHRLHVSKLTSPSAKAGGRMRAQNNSAAQRRMQQPPSDIRATAPNISD